METFIYIIEGISQRSILNFACCMAWICVILFVWLMLEIHFKDHREDQNRN